MATEQDLLDWTKEYSSLRNHHGNDDLLDFNEWMKVKIASKVQSSPPNSPIPTTPHHINRPTHSSPFISSPTPSASPSPSPPPSLSPNRFPHQPIPRHSPILSPSLSPTPTSKHTNTLPNRRPPLYFSPPLNSHSLVLRKSNHPHNPQYGNNTLSVPNDTETLKNLFLHFQNKQQQQINQVFEIVEQLNTKINNNHTTKSTKKPKKQNNNKKPKKALSPEYAIFNEQVVTSIEKGIGLKGLISITDNECAKITARRVCARNGLHKLYKESTYLTLYFFPFCSLTNLDLPND